MIDATRRLWRLAPLLLLLICISLPACSLGGGGDDKTLALVTIFPTSGPDAAVGQALQQAVDLAVKQNGSLSNGYSLVVQHIDEASALRESQLATALSNPEVVGIVGPYSSETAVAYLPEIAAAGVATISPATTLPGLTQSATADAEGVPFAKIHPSGKPLTFFRLVPTDDTLGASAADLAVAAKASHGLAAHSVFLVDDATASGKAATAAFAKELKAKGGTVAGQQSLTTGVNDNGQLVVNAIVEAFPDLVFYAGGLAAGAELRATLSLGGAPQTAILAAGPVADNPGWSDAVGQALISTHTTGVLPASDLDHLDSAKTFVSAWQSAYSGKAALPQTALAYDAAMAEIAAIKTATSKTVTRAAVATALAATKLDGAAGAVAFDQNGDSTATPSFSVYVCDTKGAWSYQTILTPHS
ncbi:MAG TPA: branched-chain amino acid ABC transporter substrate-binding protein [Ktedonobacterales bacterium]|nr:branched-chain amino acid ABC transporter substrate-binding protein [Ktedonobacterales bacterium]